MTAQKLELSSTPVVLPSANELLRSIFEDLQTKSSDSDSTPSLASITPDSSDTPIREWPLKTSSPNIPSIDKLTINSNTPSTRNEDTKIYQEHLQNVANDPSFLPRLSHRLWGSRYPPVRAGISLREFRENYIDDEVLYALAHETQSDPAISHTLPMAARLAKSARKLGRISDNCRELIRAIKYQTTMLEGEVQALEKEHDDQLHAGAKLFTYMKDAGLDHLTMDYVEQKRRMDKEDEARRRVLRERTPTPAVRRARRRGGKGSERHKDIMTRFSCALCDTHGHLETGCPLLQQWD